MMLIPLLTGLIVGRLHGGRLLPGIAFAVLALALFWLRTPLESWLGTSAMRAQTAAERRYVIVAILGIAALALSAAAVLFQFAAPAPWMALAALCAAGFALQALLKSRGRSFRMPAQIIGALVLTATAPGAYYAVTSRFDASAWALWLANWLFAGDQIHFVQVRIHGARLNRWREKYSQARGFLAGQVALALLITTASLFGFLPRWALLAFIPILLRGLAWFWQPAAPLNVRRLGWSEMLQAIVFAVLLVTAFQL
jgi:hypothetical protein